MSSSATSKRPDCDVLVVVCDAECFKAVRDLLVDACEHELFPSGTLFEQGSILDERGQAVQVALAEASAGQVAALTNKCLEALRPAYTFFLHLAAAIDPRVRLGDVVVATDIYAFEYGEQGKDFRATPEVGKSAHRLVQRAMSVARRIGWHAHLSPTPPGEEAPTAYVEPVASGRTQLQRQAPDLEILRRSYNDAVATLWGGEDFIAATHIEHIEAALICGISRELSVGGTAESPASLGRAAHVAAAFARTMIEKLGARPDGRTHEPEVEPPIDEVDERRKQLARRLDELMQIQDRELRRPLPDARLAEIAAEIRAVRGQLRSGPGLCAGEFLRGRYHLKRVLGEGGFATVWHAYDRIDNENVAIKVLHPNHGDNHETRDRFFRGAKRMARLGGSGAVRVTNTGESDRGYHYFAMELVEGNFREPIETGDIPLRERVLWVAQVARTLAAAHDDGIVHRDIRPDNILIDGDNRARLTDFDLVQLPNATRYTKQASMGDYVYAAPEQMRSGSQANRSSDVYSLAMVLIFGVLGAHPEPGLFQKDRYDFIATLRCPNALKVILARTLGYDPRDRYYAHASDFEVDLRRAIEYSDWREIQSSDERALKERVAKLRWLEQAPEGAFAAIVEQVRRQTAWQPGRASRRGLALELLQQIEKDLGPYVAIPEAALPATPRDLRPPDWENAFNTLCWADPHTFEAFLYLSTVGVATSGPRAPQAQRAAQAVDILTGPGRTDTTMALMFRWFFNPSQDGDGPSQDMTICGPNWCRFKARWVLERMTRSLQGPLRDRFKALLASRDHGGIIDALADPTHWESQDLALIPVAARARHAIASVDGEIFHRCGRPIEVTRFSLYRALCRLSTPEFEAVCDHLVPACALPRDNQAGRAREIIETYFEPACAYFADHDRPVDPAEPDRSSSTTGDGEPQLALQAPDLIFNEMLLALNISLPPELSREESLARISARGEGRACQVLRWLREDLLSFCALPLTPPAAIDGYGGHDKMIYVALDHLSVDALLQIRDALALPPWMAVPADTAHTKIVGDLVELLAWLALPRWTEAVVGSEGDSGPIVRWIEGLRADRDDDSLRGGAAPTDAT